MATKRPLQKSILPVLKYIELKKINGVKYSEAKFCADHDITQRTFSNWKLRSGVPRSMHEKVAIWIGMVDVYEYRAAIGEPTGAPSYKPGVENYIAKYHAAEPKLQKAALYILSLQDDVDKDKGNTK